MWGMLGCTISVCDSWDTEMGMYVVVWYRCVIWRREVGEDARCAGGCLGSGGLWVECKSGDWTAGSWMKGLRHVLIQPHGV